MKLLDFINEKSNNAYKDYKLVSVIFDENTLDCTFKFLYKDNIDAGDKDRLIALIKEYIKEDVSVVVKCKKAYVDVDLVKDIVFNYIMTNYNSVGVGFAKDNIIVEIKDSVLAKINCTEFQYNYLNNPDIIKDIVEFTKGYFFEDFELVLLLDGKVSNEIEEIKLDDNIYFDDNAKSDELKFNKVDNINNYIGEVIGTPIQLSSIKSSMDNIEIAGKIKFLTKKSFESKRKDKDGNQVIKEYYSFILTDKTGRMNCVYFPLKADVARSVNICDDQIVILHGNVEEFNGRINFKVKALAYCDIIEETNEVVEEEVDIIKEPNANYNCVKPEPYIEMFQDNLFLVKEEAGKYLLDHDVIVFDIETTGLEASRCEIIEIGAVKLHNGKITETFETLIKPTGEIPEEIINLTGITPEMVVDAPSIKQVMPDFYKFCYGCTIMAYNIDFDYKFISLHGRKLGYVFDNKQIDVLFLARAFIPGLKNFKLSTVCKKLEISLENAHRAVHDAMATAEVVIKLSPNITEN